MKMYLMFNLAPRREDAWKNGGIVTHILNHGTKWRRMISFTIRAALPPGNEPPVLTEYEAAWAT
jgi:hypothetical protein